MWSLKNKKENKNTQLNLFPKQKETRRPRKQTCGYQRGKWAWRKAALGVWD